MVRLNEQSYNSLQEKARENNISMSEYARLAINKMIDNENLLYCNVLSTLELSSRVEVISSFMSFMIDALLVLLGAKKEIDIEKYNEQLKSLEKSIKELNDFFEKIRQTEWYKRMVNKYVLEMEKEQKV